jgi:hypothetical protein
MGQGARRRSDIRIAAVSMIGHRRPLVAIVFERDKGTGGRAVRDGQPAFAHPGMIPNPMKSPVGQSPSVVSAGGRSRAVLFAAARC